MGRFQRSVCAFAGLCAAAWASAPALAQDNDPRPAKALQDNSFLIEEAYNQEAGVIQHILGLRRQGRDWDLVFTQEIPLWSQTHQFSYSIPYSRLRSDGQRARGLGDIFLNYRLQVLSETASIPAFAPRFSVILPSGDERRGLGDGSTGIQINLPFSKIVSDRVTLHANAGFTKLFDVQEFKPKTYTIAGSAVYAATRELNFLVEVVGEWAQIVEDPATLVRERSLTVSPGIRYAFNFDGGTQLVVGAGAPVVFTSGQRTSYGAILYLSLEHAFLKR